MEKRYQVFVSSTFVDLQEARSKVFQTLMEMDCIPAGMELFPAMDEEQVKFIKRIIDDCDYYLLIVGGRYGSVSAEGISYTEMEYDYALEKGLKVVAFLHEKPDDIPVKFTDRNPELKMKLEAFREKVRTGRLVRNWNEVHELPGLVSLSLSKTIKIYPAIGWVRADHVSSEDTLRQVNDLQKEIEFLRRELEKNKIVSSLNVEGLAGLDEKFQVRISSKSIYDNRKFSPYFTWREIFTAIAPDIQISQKDSAMKVRVARALLIAAGVDEPQNADINDEDFKTLRTQLMALGLIRLSSRTYESLELLIWELTPKGEALLLAERTVKSSGH